MGQASGMLTHTVFFFLRRDLCDGERERFEKGLRSLLGIPGSLRAVVGVPAPTAPRPVVDASYDFALELDFEDVAAHDRYQEDPVHTAFLVECKDLWSKVVVYDFAH